MIISDFVRATRNRNGVLFYGGLANVFLFLLFLILNIADPRMVLGVPVWIKPMKFSLSFVVFLWTFAWIVSWIPDQRKQKIMSAGLIVCMIAEMLTIAGQASRGVRSHFNTDTPWDALNFLVMGIFIALNTLLVIWMLILLWRNSGELRGHMRVAVLAGLVLFLLGSLSGGMMVSQSAHTVGAADGGPGVFFLNWSSLSGDLRVPHFFTLHALQIIPGFAWITGKRTSDPTVWVLLFTVAYAGVCVLLHLQALSETPLVALFSGGK